MQYVYPACLKYNLCNLYSYVDKKVVFHHGWVEILALFRYRRVTINFPAEEIVRKP